MKTKVYPFPIPVNINSIKLIEFPIKAGYFPMKFLQDILSGYIPLLNWLVFFLLREIKDLI